MSPRLLLTSVLAAATLLLAGQGTGAHAASHPASPAQSRTYLVTYTLTGTYKAMDTYSSANGQFCDNTDSAEGAKFSDSSAGAVKVVVDKAGQHVFGQAVAKSGSLGSWAGETDSVAEGDDCANVHHHVCGGQVDGETDGSGTYVAAASTATKVRFGSSLTKVPSEVSKASDCASDTDYPGLALHLEPALDPYDTVQADVTWAQLDKLGVGASIKVTAKYSSAPSGYNLATCNGDGHCKGRIDAFVHTLTIKRTR